MAKDRVVVVIAGENQTEQVFRQVKAGLSDIGKVGASVTQILGGLGLAFGAKQMLDFAKGIIDTADNMHDLAQKTGATTEFLSGLQHAAKISNVEFESVTTSLKFLAKNMASAANGEGDAADAMRALGVSALDTNGKLRPTEQVLLDIAEAFSKSKDGAGKTDIALKLLGRSGTDLIPLLNEGKAGINALTAEAERLGVVIDSETARRANELNDALDRMEARAKGAANEFLSGMLPALERLADTFASTDGKASGFRVAGERVGDTLDFVADKIDRTTNLLAKFILLLPKATGFGSTEVANNLEGMISRADAAIELANAVAEGRLQQRPGGKRFNDGSHGTGAKKDLPISGLKRELVDMTQVQNLQTALEAIDAALAGLSLGGFDKLIADVNEVLQIPEIIPKGWPEQLKALETQIDLVFGDLATKTDAVRAALDRGEIDQVTAAQQIVALHQATGEELAKLIPQYEKLAAVSKDPQTVQNVAALKQQVSDLRREVDALGQVAHTAFVENFADALSSIASNTQGAADAFKAMARSIAAELSRVIAKMLIVLLIQRMIGFLVPKAPSAQGLPVNPGLAGLGDLTLPKFGAGGNFGAGEAFIAGERGQPEIIVPSTSGTVVPLSKLGRSSQGGNIYIDARGADAGVEQRIRRAMAMMQAQTRAEAVAEVTERRLRK